MLWGEGRGGWVVSGPAEAIEDLASKAGSVPVRRLGAVEGHTLAIAAGDARLQIQVADLKTAYQQAIPDLLA